MSEKQHPMTKKAREQFEKSLTEGTPIRWMLLNQPKLRTVSDAVRAFNKHVTKYPDIAQKHKAEEIMEQEMRNERQAVLAAKTKEDAIRFLSAWYNRPQAQMAYRYQVIKEEAGKKTPEELKEEELEFKTAESSENKQANLLIETLAVNEKQETISTTEEAELAIINLQNRINKLRQKKDALEAEKIGKSGKLRKILDLLEDKKGKIAAIEQVTDIVTEEE